MLLDVRATVLITLSTGAVRQGEYGQCGLALELGTATAGGQLACACACSVLAADACERLQRLSLRRRAQGSTRTVCFRTDPACSWTA